MSDNYSKDYVEGVKKRLHAVRSADEGERERLAVGFEAELHSLQTTTLESTTNERVVQCGKLSAQGLCRTWCAEEFVGRSTSAIDAYVESTDVMTVAVYSRVMAVVLEAPTAIDDRRLMTSIVDRALRCHRPHFPLDLLRTAVARISHDVLLSSLPRVMLCLHTHWESAIGNAPQLCESIYERIIEKCAGGRQADEDMDYYVHDLPWYVRGKFRMIAVLLPVISEDTLHSITPTLLSQLRLALRHQHTATSTSHMASLLLRRIDPSKGTPFLTDVLCSNHIICREAVANYWLPALMRSRGLRLLLDAARLLYSALDDGDEGEEEELQSINASHMINVECDGVHEGAIGLDSWSVRERRLRALLYICMSLLLPLSPPSCTDVCLVRGGHRLTVDTLLVRRSSRHSLHQIRMQAILLLFASMMSPKNVLGVTAEEVIDAVVSNCHVDDAIFRDCIIRQCTKWFVHKCSTAHRASMIDRLLASLFADSNFQRALTVLTIVRDARLPLDIGDVLLPHATSICSSDVRRMALQVIRQRPVDADIQSTLRIKAMSLLASSADIHTDCARDILRHVYMVEPPSSHVVHDVVLRIGESARKISTDVGAAIDDVVPLHAHLKHMSLLVDTMREGDNHVMEHCIAVVRTCLEVLGTPTNTAEVSVGAVQTKLIKEHDSMTGEYERVATFCCLSLKHAVHLLPQLMRVDDRPSVDSVRRVLRLLVEVLTRVKGARIKGALDASASSLSDLCRLCAKTEEEAIRCLPRLMLREMITSICTAELSIYAHSRDICLASIVRATVGDAGHVHDCMLRLLDHAWSVHDDRLLPVLKCLNSFVAHFDVVLPLAHRCLQLAVDSFSSSSWAVRSAGTQLLSSLCHRMFGRHSTSTGVSCGRMTYVHWQSLLPLVGRYVEENVVAKSASLLYPLLSVLLNVNAVHTHSIRLTSALVGRLVRTLLTLVDWRLAQLCVECVVNLTPSPRRRALASRLMTVYGRHRARLRLQAQRNINALLHRLIGTALPPTSRNHSKVSSMCSQLLDDRRPVDERISILPSIYGVSVASLNAPLMAQTHVNAFLSSMSSLCAEEGAESRRAAVAIALRHVRDYADVRVLHTTLLLMQDECNIVRQLAHSSVAHVAHIAPHLGVDSDVHIKDFLWSTYALGDETHRRVLVDYVHEGEEGCNDISIVEDYNVYREASIHRVTLRAIAKHILSTPLDGGGAEEHNMAYKTR